jgi:NADH dehydrogenase
MNVAVTGAFGYSGRYIAQRLLQAGHDVITLTNSLKRDNPFGDKVEAFPFSFEDPDWLASSMDGVDVLVNTYWVRFDHRLFTHRQAIANTKILFHAAKKAGVRRIVHVSITNPDIHSELAYFRGKAEVEAELTSLGVSHCILRPAILFGKEDILVNNIAWTLRRFPVFGMFGSGDYKLQPIHVDDLAAAVVEKVGGSQNEIINAIGPETFTYRELVERIKRSLGLRRLVVGLPASLAYAACCGVGLLVGDILVTREEIRGLMAGRLHVEAPPLGRTKLTEWVESRKGTIGRYYTSELVRRLDRVSEYPSN